jgi:integrase
MSIAWENTVDETASAETQQFSADPIIDKKIRTAVAGIKHKHVQNLFLDFPTEHDKELVADYLLTCIKQENIFPNTKRIYLIALNYLSKHLQHKKSFESMTAKDLTSYLDSLKKDEDPDEGWISTQKTMAHSYMKFFKWLAYPELTPKERKLLPRNKFPAVLKEVVVPSKTGSKSPVKAKDIWTDEDTAIFLKYCTENPRLRFYHALAIETSGRPGELLQLKIGDINIESDSEGKLYTALDIGRRGKKRQSRIVGITDFTLQYYQVYLPYHPDPTNKEAFIFLSKEHSAFSRNIPISVEALRVDYRIFRDETIPKLLKNRPDIPDKDKQYLKMLREQKRWNPYNMRHSSITKLARHPAVNDYILRQHAGWSKTSNMVEVYTHELKGDSLEHIMMAYGINIKDKRDKDAQQLRKELVGSYCIYCKMVNVPNAQLCSSCHRPISKVSYDTIIREAENNKKKLEETEKKLAELLDSRLKQFQESIEAKYDRLSAELLRQNEGRLKEMNEKEREREMEVLTVLGPEALEEELEEIQAAKRAAVKVNYDDKSNPISTISDDIDCCVEEEEYDAENLEFSEE